MPVQQPNLAQTQCVVCGKSASYQCARCIEGLDTNGNVDLTHYCGRECQTSHWTAHKTQCRHKLRRTQLYRAGEILQQVFEAYYSTAPDSLRYISDLHVEDTKAMPTNVTLPVSMNMILQSVLRGITSNCEEVAVQLKGSAHTFGPISKVQAVDNALVHNSQLYRVRLTDGHNYALDLIGTKFNRPSAIAPWDTFAEQYVESILEIGELGTNVAAFETNLRQSLAGLRRKGTLERHQRIFVELHRHRAEMEAASQAALQATQGVSDLGTLVKLPLGEFESARSAFLSHFKKEITELGLEARKKGSFDRWAAQLHVATE